MGISCSMRRKDEWYITLAYVSSLDEVTLFLFDLCEKLFTADRKFN
jgi:hypothetical protein